MPRGKRDEPVCRMSTASDKTLYAPGKIKVTEEGPDVMIRIGRARGMDIVIWLELDDADMLLRHLQTACANAAYLAKPSAASVEV